MAVRISTGRAELVRRRPGEQVQAVPVGQVQVQDEQVEGPLRQLPLRLADGAGLDELAPFLAQCQADALAEGRVVLHDEDLMHEISPLIC